MTPFESQMCGKTGKNGNGNWSSDSNMGSLKVGKNLCHAKAQRE